MKNKMMKIMGVVLTLAILAGLLISAVPTSAGNLTWDQVVVPSGTTSSLQLTQTTDVDLFKIAPDGKTVFAYNTSYSGAPADKGLYKSTDAGVTWTQTNVGAGLPAGIIAMAVSPTYATDTTVIAATTSALYRSRNGGQSFLAVTTAPVTLAAVNSVDVAPYYISTGGTALLVGMAGSIALYSDDTGWISVATVGTTAGFETGRVVTAKFSPTYQSDGEILAVVTALVSPSIGLATPGTVLETKFASSNWNATVRPAELKSSTDVTFPLLATGVASLAFPSDYNSSSSTLNRVYVALGDITGTGAPYDVYRVNGSINSTGTIVTGTRLKLTDQVSSNSASVAYTGTVASGTLVAGQLGTGGVWSATTPNGTASWTQALNPPTGQNVMVAFAPTTATTTATTGAALYAGTKNLASPAGFGAGFFTSTDYSSFKGLSLISLPNLAAVNLSAFTFGIRGSKDQFLMVGYQPIPGPNPAVGDIQLVFKSVDNGATWAEVFSLVSTTSTNGVQKIANINPTGTYATDNTVYLPQNTNLIWKSTDGGATWNSITATTPNNSISAFAVIDANTYWLGSTGGGLYKSGSYTQTALLDGTVPFQIFALPIGIVINTLTGEVYLSTDNAATFTRLGNAVQFTGGKAPLAFDVAAKTIYGATADTATLKKWVVGTSTSWEDVATLTTPWVISGLVLAGDGTLYVRSPNTGATNAQLVRCVNLTAPTGQQVFVGIPSSDPTAFVNTGNLPAGRSTYAVNDATAQTNTIYQIIKTTTSTQNGYPYEIKSYIDTLTGKTTITAPAAKASIGTSYTFTWKPIPSPQQVTYNWQIATDDQFQGIQLQGNTTAQSAYVSTLIPGTQYYFRVSATLPLPSKWSDTVPFTVKLAVSDNQDLTGALGNRIAPAAGATGVPLTPSFQWASVTGADSYKIQVADNPGFTSPIADATTKDTFFTVATPLKPGTTYYWRIQAISGTNSSDYVSNVFTTAAPVVAPPASTGTGAPPVQTAQPTIIVTVPPAQVPPAQTPAYIWVIIVIGAILVIAVIVLIARTRRV